MAANMIAAHRMQLEDHSMIGRQWRVERPYRKDRRLTLPALVDGEDNGPSQ